MFVCLEAMSLHVEMVLLLLKTAQSFLPCHWVFISCRQLSESATYSVFVIIFVLAFDELNLFTLILLSVTQF